VRQDRNGKEPRRTPRTASLLGRGGQGEGEAPSAAARRSRGCLWGRKKNQEKKRENYCQGREVKYPGRTRTDLWAVSGRKKSLRLTTKKVLDSDPAASGGIGVGTARTAPSRSKRFPRCKPGRGGWPHLAGGQKLAPGGRHQKTDGNRRPPLFKSEGLLSIIS